MLRREEPLAIYMDGAMKSPIGKMGFGILRYSPNPIACVIDSEFAGQDAADVTGIPRNAPIVATIQEAIAKGAKVLVLGIAPSGGLIPAEWFPFIDDAVNSGLSVVNGLHDLLGPRYPALRGGQYIWDIRIEPAGLGVATGATKHLANKRVLMIGTDMAIGKMTAGLELYRVLKEQGVTTEFVATGQIGITITGRGIPLDAIRVDYASGAVERSVLEASKQILNVPSLAATSRESSLLPGESTPTETQEGESLTQVVIIEGQGALAHPGSSANLPLIRGSMPTHLILCHKARLTHLQKLQEMPIPPLVDYIKLYEDLAGSGGSFPRPVTIGIGIALNTSELDEYEAVCEIAKVERETGLVTVDPVRFGPDRLANALIH